MAFTEIEFIFFVAICLFIYLASGRKWQILLAASFLYYSFYDPRAFLYLITAIITTFYGGKLLYKKKSKIILFATLIINFGMLFVVKFTDLSVFKTFIPLGISFYIFQATSYTIDLYRQKYKPQENLFKYALYLSFFPQIVQGPISRYDEISEELYNDKVDEFYFSRGFLLILYGYFKKLLIADRAAILVGNVFNSPDEFSGVFVFIAIIFYSIQIYCDFSGGIDIARGIAYLFGIRLSENFKRPFFAESISDFWRRWHITLGSWMREYVFFPLSLTKSFAIINKKSRKILGRHKGKVLTITISTYIVYLLIGVWHGGGFNFIAFGLYNGTLISLSLLFENKFKKLKKNLGIEDKNFYYRIFKIIRTLFLVFIGRYFTRSKNLTQAIYMLKKTFSDFNFRHGDLGIKLEDVYIIALSFLIVAIISLLQEREVDITEKIINSKSIFNFLFIVISIMAFNFFTDSFNVFGDVLFKWASYDFTQNPRTAKITYLKNVQKDKNYKNFIVGASGASSIPIEKLKEYTKRDYFNVFHYGADLYDTVKTVEFLVKNYEIESIIMPFAIPSASKYNEGRKDLNYLLHKDVSGENSFSFYKKYLFANPRYGIDKIKARRKDNYLPQGFDVFKTNGSYDKRVRDTEYIGSKEEYIENLDFKVYNEKIKLNHIDDAVNSIKRIKELCDENNIEIKFILTPMHNLQNNRYDKEEVDEYLKKVSEVTEFWDFKDSTIENDPRYFYDPSHFRNAVGDLILDKIYKDSGEFGKFIPRGTYEPSKEENIKDMEKSFYIYAFHHIAEDGDGIYTVSPKRFEEFLKYLEKNNIQIIKFKDLIEFVEGKKELPDKFGLITFDDGYKSNLDIAYPLLKKYNQVATIFPIGKLMGRDKYPVTGQDMIEHFSKEDARLKSDVFEYGSHSYFFHQSYPIEDIKFRKNLKILDGEDEKDYIKDFREDSDNFNKVYSQFNEQAPYVFAYPQGVYDDLTEVLLTEEAYKATVTSDEGKNYIVKYLPESLRRLRRVNITENRNLDEFNI